MSSTPAAASAPPSRSNDVDGAQPFFDEPRPFSDRILRAAQTKRVAAVSVKMHLRRDARTLQRDIIDDRLVELSMVSVSACSRKVDGVVRVT